LVFIGEALSISRVESSELLDVREHQIRKVVEKLRSKRILMRVGGNSSIGSVNNR
jgi:Fic family protein